MRILALALNPAIDVSSDVARVYPTRKMRTRNQKQHVGGGGVNVARVVVELGGEPELLLISGGATGALMEDALGSMPIRVDVVHAREPTRIAFMVHEEETNLEYRFVPEGPLVDEAEINAALSRIETYDGEFLVGSGSLPRGADVETYARIGRIAARNGSRYILDTSGEPLRAALDAGGIFMVKPSIGELGSFAGAQLDATSAGAAAMDIVGRGAAKYVAVTMGRDGAILAGPEGVIRLAAMDVPVRSAVGAGDAFVAAFVWSIARGDDAAEAFRFAVAAGAAAVMTSGTELCHAADVHAVRARMGERA